MSPLISQLTPMVIGLLMSPIPIAALIIILMTARAKRNGASFILGWLVGIFSVGLAVISFPNLEAGNDTPSPYAPMIRVFLGGLLLCWAAYKIIKRYRTTNPKTPKFFQRLDHISSQKSFGIGLLVSAGNVKNLGFSAAAATLLNQADMGFSASFGYLLGYSLIGSITVIIPMIIYLLFHHKADIILLRWKGWLIRNHDYLLSAVVIFVGIMILTSGS